MKNLWEKITIYFMCIVLGVSLWTIEGIYVNAKTPIQKGAVPQGLELATNSKNMKKLTSGVCGENITWTYNKTSKTLEFSGTGAIYDTEGAGDGEGLIGSWSVWKKEANHLIIGEGITEIGYANFYEFFRLKSISLPNTLLEIGDIAFVDTFLESSVTIVFPPNLKKIGRYAFATNDDERGKIVSVTLPNGLERLGDYVFARQSIREIVIPGTVQYMNYGVLSECSKLEKLTLESGVETLPYQMCSGCINLKTVEMPNTLREIGGEAFAGCKKLKEIKLPEEVQRILNFAFYDSGITKITIPDAVKTLGQDTFMDCAKLKQVKLPAHLTEIKPGLFMNCKKLEQVKIPQTVTSVTLSAFWGTSVTKIVLPKNVTSLKKDVDPFHGDAGEWRKARIKKLRQLVIQSSKLKKVSKGAFSGIEKNCVIKVPKGKVKKYKKMIYKSGVDKKVQVKAIAKTSIQKGAIPRGLDFAGDSKSMKKLTSDACGENITWTYDKTSKTLEFSGTGDIYDTEGATGSGYGLIGSWSVWKEEACHLIIGEGITEIGYANFYEFYSLKSISLPNTLLKIGDDAFEYSFSNDSLSVVLPPNLKKIGSHAFATESGKIVSVTLPNGLERLGTCAFAGQSIKEIVIPGTIQYMDSGILQECEELEKLTLESGVEMLPYEMCRWCFNLKSVEIPNTVRKIEGLAFYGCKKLKNIKIPEGVQSIGVGAFEGTGITQITIPDTVKTMEENVFVDCAKLKQVKLPSHLSEIKDGLFMDCKKLEQVKIPQTVTSVSLSAFWGTSITKIVLPKNVTRLVTDTTHISPAYMDVPAWHKARMKKLKQLVIQSPKLKKVSKGAFSGIEKNCVIKVPKGRVKKYKEMIYKSGVDKAIKVKAIAKKK